MSRSHEISQTAAPEPASCGFPSLGAWSLSWSLLGFACGVVLVTPGEGEDGGLAGGALVMSRSTNEPWLPLPP